MYLLSIILAFFYQSPCDLVVGIDLTPLQMEAYEVYDTDMDRWHEIKDELLDTLGGAQHTYLGLYNFYGSWMYASEFNNGIRLTIGSDWTIGNDGQRHNADCFILSNEVPNMAIKLKERK